MPPFNKTPLIPLTIPLAKVEPKSSPDKTFFTPSAKEFKLSKILLNVSITPSSPKALANSLTLKLVLLIAADSVRF